MTLGNSYRVEESPQGRSPRTRDDVLSPPTGDLEAAMSMFHLLEQAGRYSAGCLDRGLKGTPTSPKS